jgi:dephospho-CoA kinase
MAEKRFLSKAPIKEALIDIQVVLSNDVTIDDLDKQVRHLMNLPNLQRICFLTQVLH